MRRRFKEEVSLTNFLFYGFLIKGLGAEISAVKDCQKRQRTPQILDPPQI
jgi:hypothetical protein